jgi:transporter family-2 protein
MGRPLAVLLAFAAGLSAAAQAPINAALRQAVGALRAGLISAAVTAALFLIAALTPAGGLTAPGDRLPPWQYLAGGALGFLYVVGLLSTVRVLGATGLLAAVIAGQLTFAVLLDQFGLLGLEHNPVSLSRIAGLLLLLLGGAIVVRG